MSIEIGGVVFTFDPEYQSVVDKFTWYITNDGYAQTMLPARKSATGQREAMYLHQLIDNLHYNIPLGDRTYLEYGMHIDHINNDKTDNHASNLQYLTVKDNKRKQKPGKSGYHGVWANGNGHQTGYHLDGKFVNIGTYATALEAAEAYNKRIIELGLDHQLNLLPAQSLS